MNINEKILGQIYMSPNYDAQPLETEKKIDNPETSGSKPEGAKPLEDRTIFQIGDTKCDLASDNFRIGLYNFVKEQGGLKDELATIRQRLNLTEKGDARSDPNKKIDTRSVINEVFAQSSNVRAKVDAVLAGVVNFSEDVKKEICDAIWRQRDNPDIHRFLQSGGNAYDLAAICKLTLDSMKERGFADFAHRMVMSYLKGFTLGMSDSPIRFDKEFEKSFEEDQLFREERTGIEDRRLVELQGLRTSAEEALAKLENDTKDLLPASDKKVLSVDEKYLRGKYDDIKNELQKFCNARTETLTNANADDLKKLLGENFKDELTQKVDEWVNKMKEFQELAQKLDQLAKFTPDYGKVCGEAPADSKEKANYDQARSKFEADYKQATTSAEGDMCKYLNELKENVVSDESLKKIWTAHYQNATQQIENNGPKAESGNSGDEKNVKVTENKVVNENNGKVDEKKENKEVEKEQKIEMMDINSEIIKEEMIELKVIMPEIEEGAEIPVSKRKEVDEENKLSENKEKIQQQDLGVKNQEDDQLNDLLPKENLNKNELDEFVVNGVFKDNILPKYNVPSKSVYYRNENFLACQKKGKEILRDKIIPRWTSLTDRLVTLRRETMSILGIGMEKEAWFKCAYPELDESSESFLTKVYKNGVEGKSVKEAEDCILAVCRLKNMVSFRQSKGAESIFLKFVVGENPSGGPEDNTIYVKKPEDLEQKNYQQQIANFARDKNLNIASCDSKCDITLNTAMNTAAYIGMINDVFVECVDQLSELDEALSQATESLNSAFTEEERKEIGKIICDAVIKPIKDAKNIWDIQPNLFMSNIVKQCIDNDDYTIKGVMKVMKKIVKNQVEANFEQSKNEMKCLIKTDKKMDQKALSPREVIESAIKDGLGLKQKGGRNCFMVSIVNALLGNEKGQEILKKCFCNTSGNYRFKNQEGKTIELTDAEVEEWVKKDINLKSMSKLEQTIWAAWLKAKFKEPSKYDSIKLGRDAPGNQCGASDFAFLFGLTTANSRQGNSIDGVALTGGQLSRWVDAQKHLASGQIAVAHHGGAENGHYVAITGAVSKGLDGGRGFSCFDSTGNDTWLDLKRVQVDLSKNEPNLSQIFLLTLPEVVV